MTSLVRPPCAWLSPPRLVLTLALLAGHLAAHAAAPDVPGPPDPSDTGPVIVTTDPLKQPHKHRDVKRAPVKPDTDKYPSKPQQPVQTLR
jgi:hypothetical protein